METKNLNVKQIINFLKECMQITKTTKLNINKKASFPQSTKINLSTVCVLGSFQSCSVFLNSKVCIPNQH